MWTTELAVVLRAEVEDSIGRVDENVLRTMEKEKTKQTNKKTT